MARKKQYNPVPVVLSEKEFNEFILPHLKRGSIGANKKNIILQIIQLHIEIDAHGMSVEEYTYRKGCIR